MGVVEGKVALVTGAARGQGRSHAVRLAEEGASLALCDSCSPVASIPYDLPGPDELAATVRLVEEAGARVVADRVDVRDLEGLTALVARAEAELGTVDVVCANAGIVSYAKAWEFTRQQW
jgi:NAD(P)-dependent dehydrogenase (short-subunit alcohol dehydrogenase family)